MKNLIIALLLSSISSVLFSQKQVNDSIIVLGGLKFNSLHTDIKFKNINDYKILVKVFYSETDSVSYQTNLNSFESFRFSFIPKQKPTKINVSALNKYSIIAEKNVEIRDEEILEGQRTALVVDLIEKEKNYSAGDELILYTRRMYLGYSLQMVGGSVVLISTLVAKKKLLSLVFLLVVQYQQLEQLWF